MISKLKIMLAVVSLRFNPFDVADDVAQILRPAIIELIDDLNPQRIERSNMIKPI